LKLKKIYWSTIEIYPDKKKRVGSLRSPREYDGRLPPDAGYYLDLVLPRSEEPRKNTRACLNNLHGRILQIQWSNYTQSILWLSANLLVILVRIPVNLLVKPTRLGSGVRGAHGALSAGKPGNPGSVSSRRTFMIHLGEARTISQLNETMMRLLWDYYGTIARNIG